MQLPANVSLILLAFICLTAIMGLTEEELKCETSKDCERYQHKDFEVMSVCHNATCKCFAFRNPIECFTKADERTDLIYRQCPCNMPDSECKEDFCHCKGGFVPSRNLARCVWEIRKFHQECEFDQQCEVGSPFTVCNKTGYTWSRECMCRHGYTKLLSWKCHALVADASRIFLCSKDWHCLKYNSAVCALDMQRCVCKEGYVFVYPDCLSASDWGKGCVVDGQCQYRLGGGGICDASVCHCKEPYVKTEEKAIWGNIKYACILPDWENYMSSKKNQTQPVPEYTNVTEFHEYTDATEFDEYTNTTELYESTNATELHESTNATELHEYTNTTELYESTNTTELNTTEPNATELHEYTNTAQLYESTNATELHESTNATELHEYTNTTELYKSTNAT